MADDGSRHAPLEAGASDELPQPLGSAAASDRLPHPVVHPADITVNVGQPITLVLKNQGTVLPDFVSMDAKVDGTEELGAMHDMAGMEEPAMHAAVEAGQESTIKFPARQAGTYTFALELCHSSIKICAPCGAQ